MSPKLGGAARGAIGTGYEKRPPVARGPFGRLRSAWRLALAREADHHQHCDRAQEDEAQDRGGHLVEDARCGIRNFAAGRGRVATEDALGRAGAGRLALALGGRLALRLRLRLGLRLALRLALALALALR